MKGYTILGAFLIALIGLVGTGCPSETFLCRTVADCFDHEDSCPSGEELFCNVELGGVCDCAGGTGGMGGAGGTAGSAGAGGSGGSSSSGSCDDCVGTSLGPDNTNPAVSCAPGGEQFACVCLDEMGTSHPVYMSTEGCY